MLANRRNTADWPVHHDRPFQAARPGQSRASVALGSSGPVRRLLRTPDGLVQAIPEVLEGRADFGIGAADVLVAIDGGANLMIASPVFQQSGFGLI